MPNQFDHLQQMSDIAAAPGTLPMPQVKKRVALKALQFRHDNTIDPLAPQANEPVTITATSGSSLNITHAELWYTTNGRLPTATNSIKRPMHINRVDWTPEIGYFIEWQATIPGQARETVVRYTIVGWQSHHTATAPLFAHDGQGFWFNVIDEQGVRTFAYLVEKEHTIWPAWMDEAVIYQIFVDRFHSGQGDGQLPAGQDPQAKHFGTLKGVEMALPYLASLGINCIWLSPIAPAETYHRYDIMDFFNVDPDLGTNEALRQLIAKVHARGMRIILDYVPSHCSWHHPAFVAAQQDPNAPTASWFVFNEWPHDYRCFLGIAKLLPSFDTNDPNGRKHLIDGAAHWLTEYDFDGFRLDHTIAHGMDFWVEFRQAVEAAKPDAVLIAEATDTPDALRHYRGRIHSILDFPLAQAFRLTFGTGDWTLSQFDSFWQTYIRYMADGPKRVSFLDNHDMNRFHFVAGQRTNRLKLAALCQFTLATTPTIYYGTEIGMTHEVDKDAQGFGGDALVRQDMIWDETLWDQQLLTFYRSLIHLRHTEPSLHRGQYHLLHVDDTTQTYAYTTNTQTQPFAIGNLLTLLNMSQTPQTITLPTTAVLTPRLTTNQTTITQQQKSNHTTISLPAETGIILKITPPL